MEEMHPSSSQDTSYAGMSFRAPRSSSPVAYLTSTDASPSVALTRDNLNRHCQHSTRVCSNPITSVQMRQDRSEKIRAAIRSLDIDLPKHIVNKMAANFDGMTPMGRYLAEQTVDQGNEESAGGDLSAIKPTNSAHSSTAGNASLGTRRSNGQATVGDQPEARLIDRD